MPCRSSQCSRPARRTWPSRASASGRFLSPVTNPFPEFVNCRSSWTTWVTLVASSHIGNSFHTSNFVSPACRLDKPQTCNFTQTVVIQAQKAVKTARPPSCRGHQKAATAAAKSPGDPRTTARGPEQQHGPGATTRGAQQLEGWNNNRGPGTGHDLCHDPGSRSNTRPSANRLGAVASESRAGTTTRGLRPQLDGRDRTRPEPRPRFPFKHPTVG